MSSSSRMLACAAGILFAASAFSVAAAGVTKSVAYFGVHKKTYLIDWQPRKRAHVVNPDGAGIGTVANDGTRKTITLDAPITMLVYATDSCGTSIQQNRSLTQLTVRDVDGDGTSEVKEIGSYTNIGGCEPGLETPFQEPDGAAGVLKRKPMAARAPMDDLLPGTQWVGFSEQMLLPEESLHDQLVTDLVTLQADGTALFQSSGQQLPAVLDANGWLVISFPTGPVQQRAYTRLGAAGVPGGENWLVAEWVDGQPRKVSRTFIVEPVPGTTFGTEAQAARRWKWGDSVGTREIYATQLYLNEGRTGEEVRKNLDSGTETRSPIASWRVEGPNILQSNPIGGDVEVRTAWIPLRSEAKIHWVMGSRTIVASGNIVGLIGPFLAYYVDAGEALPPLPYPNRQVSSPSR